MFLKSIRIDNVRAIADLELDFDGEDGGARKWTLLLGENGTGKSTILRCIALLLCGRDALAELLGRDPSSWIRSGRTGARIDGTIATAQGEEREIHLELRRDETISRTLDRNTKPLALPLPQNFSLDFMKPLRYGGRHGDSESVSRILRGNLARLRDVLDGAVSQGVGSLGQVADRVCEAFDFRDGRGRWQRASCCRALSDLQAAGHVSLPAGQPARGVGGRARVLPHPVAPAVDVPGTVDEVGGLTLVLVETGEQRRVWNTLMAHEHPRGAGPFVGPQLRYLVGSAHGWLGGVGFAASARRLRARDAWVGWDDTGRRAHLHRVLGLCRLLVRPGVACRNLASHVLGRAARAVGDDCERLYGYRPWLLETFVDETEQTGASVRAANCGRRPANRPAKDRRAARVAEVTLRYQQVALPCPGAAPVELWVVHVREEQPPPRTEPLQWFLLTTLQVTSAVDATRILQWYALRWRIEEYFRVLKSGCKVEELQHHTAERLKRHGHQDGHRVADPVDGPARARGARPAGRPAVLRWRIARARHLRPLTQAAAAGAPRRRRRSGRAPRRVARTHTRPARGAVDVARLHPTGCHGLRLRTAGRIRMTSRSIQFSPGHPGHGQR